MSLPRSRVAGRESSAESYNHSTWLKLHNATPLRFVTGDIDGGGEDDLVVNFGAAGL